MIYSAFGLPVTKIISGSIEENKVRFLAYGGPSQHYPEIEEYERSVAELRADNGINEIHDAIKNPDSYNPDINDVRNYFQEYCK